MNETETNLEAERPVKTTFRSRLVWLALFGFLLGMVMKTEAAKRVTMGFEDYKLGGSEKYYDIEKLRLEIAAKEEAAKKAQADQNAVQAAPQPDNGAGNKDAGADSACDSGSGDTCQVKQ